MSTYTIPRVEIDQQFQSIPTFADNPLAALVIGPQYKLFRYGTADEKAYTSVVNPNDPVIPDTSTLGNQYVPSAAVTYAWPNQPADSVVDQSYTKVFFANAKARYFPNDDLGSGTPGNYNDFEAVHTVAGGSVHYPNRIKAVSANTINLKTFGSTSCSSFLGDRGVKVGDIVEITGTRGGSGGLGTLQTTITNLLPSYAAPTYGVNHDTNTLFTDFYSKANTTFSIGTSTWQTGVRVTGIGSALTVATDEAYTLVLASNNGVYSTRGAVGAGFTFDSDSETLVFNTAHSLEVDDLVYFDVNGGTMPNSDSITNVGTTLASWCAYWVHSVPTATTVKLKNSPTADALAVTINSAGSGDIRLYKGLVRAQGSVTLAGNVVTNIVFDPAYTTSFNVPASTQSAPYFSASASAATSGALLTNFRCFSAVTSLPSFAYFTNWPTLVSALADVTCDIDIVYTITVTRGGLFYTGSGDETTCARVRISSNKGDGNATQVLVPYNTSFAVGTKGLTAKFATTAGSTGLALGDSWSISLVAGGISEYNIVEVDTNLWGTVDTVFNPAQPVTVAMYLTKDSVEIPQFQDFANTIPNWTQAADGSGIEINSSYIDSPIYVTDPLLEKNSTELAKLPVNKNYAAAANGDLNGTFTPAANVYVQYRALIKDHTAEIGSITDITTIEADLGPIVPDNPLAQGVYHAKLNAGESVPVYYVGLASDDVAGYNLALSFATKSNKVYGIVPLSGDMTIGELIANHVDDLSQKSKARWRVAWLAPTLQTTSTFLDTYTSNGAVVDYTATITANPSTGFVELLTISAGSNQKPLVGLREGDIVQYDFSYNVQGTLVWQEVAVTSTLTNTTCLVTPLDAAVSTATKIKIIRTMTADEKTDAFVSLVQAYDDRRVRFVFPNTFKYLGDTLPSYYLAAACAGLRSSVVPHQPLTNYSIAGIDAAGGVSDTYEVFSTAQLDAIAETGCWIIAQDFMNQTPYVRHQLTSNYAGGVYHREDSITTNVDSISYGLQRKLEPYIGKYNINPANIALITAVIESELTFRATNTFTQSAGHQLISYKINSIGQHATFKDRIDAEIQLEVPTPLNNVNVTLLI